MSSGGEAAHVERCRSRRREPAPPARRSPDRPALGCCRTVRPERPQRARDTAL